MESALTSAHNALSNDMDDFFSEKPDSSKMEHGAVLAGVAVSKASDEVIDYIPKRISTLFTIIYYR